MMKINNIINRYNQIYNNGTSPFGDKKDLRKRIVNLVNFTKKSKVLEIGCGDGNMLQEISERAKFSIGLEICDVALNCVQKRELKNTFLVQAESERLPFRDSSFDIIFCLGVLEHISSIDAGIEELTRVLKKNGTTVIIIPNKYWFRKFLYTKPSDNKYVIAIKIVLSIAKACCFHLLRRNVCNFDWGKGRQPIENEYSIFEVKRLFEKNMKMVRILPTEYVGNEWGIKKFMSMFPNPLLSCFEFLLMVRKYTKIT